MCWRNRRQSADQIFQRRRYGDMHQSAEEPTGGCFFSSKSEFTCTLLDIHIYALFCPTYKYLGYFECVICPYLMAGLNPEAFWWSDLITDYFQLHSYPWDSICSPWCFMHISWIFFLNNGKVIYWRLGLLHQHVIWPHKLQSSIVCLWWSWSSPRILPPIHTPPITVTTFPTRFLSVWSILLLCQRLAYMLLHNTQLFSYSIGFTDMISILPHCL